MKRRRENGLSRRCFFLVASSRHHDGYQPIQTGYIGSPRSNITQIVSPTGGVVTLLPEL
jgi:hypothetical protein